MTLAQKLKDPEWLAQTSVQLLTLNPGGVAVQLAQTLKRESKLAADLVDTFCRAMEKACGHDLHISLKRQDWAELDLSNLDPQFPSHHPLFRVALDGLLKAASAKYIEPVSLERRVRQEFAQAFYDTVRNTGKPELKDYLAEFRQAYDLPEGQLMEHTNQVLLFVSAPLPIDPTTTLKQMYIEPMATYQYLTGEDKDKEEKAEVSLLPHLAQILQDSREPVVVHGQPGHGKSSAMKMLVHASLAAHQPSEGPITLLFLEFKNLLRLDRSVWTILSEQCRFIKDESFFDDRNTLLILDGMDERQVTENADRDLKEFLRLMMAVAKRVNKRAGSRLNLVVTGRSQFFQGVRSAFDQYHAFELLDFDEERIGHWLTKFNQLKKLSEPWSYQKLHDCQFGELLGQPILLTMVGLLISDPKHGKLVQTMGKVNRAKVYETIIKWTHQKRWHEDKKSPEVDEQTFFDLLQAVAFCMFCGGSENILLKDLTKNLERHKDLLDIELPGPDRLESLCSELAISFFFKGIEDKAFSFIHKSFGDFLLGGAMFKTLKRLAGLKMRNRVGDMYLLLGARPLSLEDHRPFILEIAENAREESINLVPTLSEFIKSAQSHHYLLQYGKDLSENPMSTEAALLSGALTWLVACNQVQEKPQVLDVFPGQNEFYRYLSILEAAPITTIKAFSFLDLQKTGLARTRLSFSIFARADLRGAIFWDADLRGADLWGANLRGADLRGADLRGANLRGANLHDADLTESNLRGADLRGANLHDADLTESKLGRANLGDADLGESNLLGADLTESNFRGADLRGAELGYANLGGADLGGADLRGAHLGGAHIGGAHLGGANLEGANLEGAHLYNVDFEGIRNWREIKNLETAIIDHIRNPPHGFLEHVESLKNISKPNPDESKPCHKLAGDVAAE